VPSPFRWRSEFSFQTKIRTPAMGVLAYLLIQGLKPLAITKRSLGAGTKPIEIDNLLLQPMDYLTIADRH
ncbi:hypothetical protein, partial [Algoriphagus sp. AK58]|uniref:hypothetical protein n=1 Tax=Algoriphagus sp. AK58 TaxID=1406877 RepID=UPI001C9C114E